MEKSLKIRKLITFKIQLQINPYFFIGSEIQLFIIIKIKNI